MRLLHSRGLLSAALLVSEAWSSNLPSQKPLHSVTCGSSDRDQAVLDLHKLLVNTESVSGHEHAVGVRLTQFLEAHNFTVEHQTLPGYADTPSKAPRKNVFAYKGSRRKTRILVTSHIDTVPPFYPWELRKDEIWGRGSVDAKACVATQIAAVMELLENSEVAEDDIALLYVVGEEVNGDGMKEANNLGLSWESVVFGEPTEFKLASGHKGSLTLYLTAHGKAGHSGYPWLSVNANHMLLAALFKLLEFKLPGSDRYGETTVNVGRMDGGVAPNVISEKAEASVFWRLAGGDPSEISQRISKLIKDVDERITFEFGNGYGPIPCDTDIAGFESMAMNYGTDIPWLKGNHKRYLYGPGSILVAHSDHEHLSIQELLRAVGDYKKIILAALS